MADAERARSTTNQIETTLASRLGESRFDRYFAHDARLDVEGRTLRVRVKDRFYADWLSKRFGRDLETVTRETIGDDDAAIDWVIDPEAFGVAEETSEEAPAPPTSPPRATRTTSPGRRSRPTWKNPPLNSRLDSFIVGASNRLAYGAARRVAEGDHSVDFSMLFLHGECGVGKTHLLQGIANEFRKNRPGARVQYVTGEAFANRYIAAVYKGKMARFRDSFRDLDLLCIDDVHFISGKDKTMSECLHTLNDLDLHGARIVLASDEHPRRIAKLDHRLQSRLLAGMIVALDRPDESTRREMIERFSSSRGLSLEPAALGMLAERCEGSVRDIIGVITRLDALLKITSDAGLPSRHVTPAVVHRALDDVHMSRPTRPIKVTDIAATVCDELRVDLSEMFGSSRHKRVVLARSVTAHLSRDLTTRSYPEIASQMQRSNHSTIVTACQRIARSLRADERVEDPLTNEMRPLGDVIERLRAAVLRDSARVSSA